jgi:diguanylate cyclase (GGDEF)-like protein
MELSTEVAVMLASTRPLILVASADPALIAQLKPVLTSSSAEVEVAPSVHELFAAISDPHLPALVLMDAALPGFTDGRCILKIRAKANGHTVPLVLLADDPSDACVRFLIESSFDDIVPRSVHQAHWQLRLQIILRTFHRMRELEWLREAAARHAQTDHLTGVYNRSAVLSQLFRETDRMQRMQTSLCLLQLDIDDFSYWNQQLGQTVCDDLLCQVTERILRLLRSYDLFGRTGNDEFLAILPGCEVAHGILLAERLRKEVFSVPFQVSGGPIRLTSCFGVAASEGRSPVVVLHDVERALQAARLNGPESVQSVGASQQTLAGPAAFLPDNVLRSGPNS